MTQNEFLVYAIIVSPNENVMNIMWNMNCENFKIELKSVDEAVLKFINRVDTRQYYIIIRMLKKIVMYSTSLGVVAFGYKGSEAPEIIKFQKNRLLDVEIMSVLELETVEGWKSLTL
jgi:hypothetical protein